jgi:hypothetical protein
MWIFTTHGFFSITRTRQQPEMMQIRARQKEHLQNLQKRFTADGFGMLGNIIETPDADYRFRIITEPATVQIVLANLADDINYPNFKSACHAAGFDDNRTYINALHAVWTTMYSTQQIGGFDDQHGFDLGQSNYSSDPIR